MREAKIAAVSIVATVVVMLLIGRLGSGSSAGGPALVRPAAAEGLEYNEKLNAYVTTMGDGLILWHLHGSEIGSATQYYIGEVSLAGERELPRAAGQKPAPARRERFLFSENYRPAPAKEKYRGRPLRMRAWGASAPGYAPSGNAPSGNAPPAPPVGGASCGGGGDSCG